jgi:5-methylthioadenosine/S-adenosylhomocysteine deaminase
VPISDDQLLTLALAARAPGNTTPEVATHDWKLARDLAIRISVHVGMRLTGVHVNHVLSLHQLGLMGPDTTYIHCTDSTDQELDLIASTGGTVSVAPFVEMLMGHGVPPTGRLVARGVRPSLSIDVVSSVPGDMFTQMRTALVQERILAFTESPDVPFAPTLTHRDVLEFATIDGARACALDHKVGTITPGKQADIVMIRTDQVNVAPVVDPVATVVIAADTSNVDTVMVAGRIVKQHGQLTRVDLSSLLRRLDSARDHLLSKAGTIPQWVLSRRD